MTAARLTPVAVGAGVLGAHEDGAVGSVVGTFRHGCYVQVDTLMYAVAGPSVMAGPIHLVVAEDPPATSEGQAVWRDGQRVRTTGWEIDLSDAPLFAPPMPDANQVVRAGPALAGALQLLTAPKDLAAQWEAVRAAVAGHDLITVRALLEGRGGGLTPTGDDVLAGILLVHAWSGSDPGLLADLGSAAATTNLSRSFLLWAARGESLAPVHELFRLGADRDADGFDEVVETVSAIGGSSGIALLWGLGLACAAVVSRAREGAAPPGRSST